MQLNIAHMQVLDIMRVFSLLVAASCLYYSLLLLLDDGSYVLNSNYVLKALNSIIYVRIIFRRYHFGNDNASTCGVWNLSDLGMRRK